MNALNHAALLEAAKKVRSASSALAARTRVAEFRFEFTPMTVREIEDRRHLALPTAAARSFLGDCLHQQERELFSRCFEPAGDSPGFFALAGPGLPWPSGSEIPGGGRAVSLRVVTWDPSGELLPALLLSGTAAASVVGDGRVTALGCPVIHRLDPESWFPAFSPESGPWRFQLGSPLQLRRRDTRSGRRLQFNASAASPGLIARAAWLRIAELSRHTTQPSDAPSLDPRFAEDAAFTDFTAALDAISPMGAFFDANARWRSKRQGGKKIDLSGVAGTWPARGAWSAEEAIITLGEPGAALWDVLLRVAALYQIGRKTSYGCGLLIPVADLPPGSAPERRSPGGGAKRVAAANSGAHSKADATSGLA